MIEEFHYHSRQPQDHTHLYQFHMAQGAFEMLLPPWQKGNISYDTFPIQEGTLAKICIRDGLFKMRMQALHKKIIPNTQFQDELIQGPFQFWQHTHRFEEIHENESMLLDHIRYALPLPAISHRLLKNKVEKELRRLFKYRHALTYRELELRKRWETFSKPSTVVLTGASGMIGQRLALFLSHMGIRVIQLIRDQSNPHIDQYQWDAYAGTFPNDTLEKLSNWSWVHLSGSNIASGRWSADRKKTILDSRVKTTENIVSYLSSQFKGELPKAFISASAAGYYGYQSPEPRDENSPKGDGFLADVCEAWENACIPLYDKTRVCHLRSSVVLDPKDGALGKMILPFKLGLGGKLGSGEQKMSWVSLHEAISIVREILFNDTLSGPINVSHPDVVTSETFTRTLSHVLSRPHLIPLPAPILKMGLGEMAEETLLAQQNVVPQKLKDVSYPFAFQSLEDNLGFILGR